MMITDVADICDHSDQSAARLIKFSYELLDKDTDDELKCYGYRRKTHRVVIFYILTLLSLGILYLLTHWKPSWRINMTCSPCLLCDADCVLLEDRAFNIFQATVAIRDVTQTSTEGTTQYVSIAFSKSRFREVDDTSALTLPSRLILRYFDHRNVRYLWHFDQRSFVRVIGLEPNLKCSDMLTKFTGLTNDAADNKLLVYGKNGIMVEVKSYPKLFFEEILNPFYVFQIFSVIWWCLDDYFVYASCIIVISLVSLGVELYETRKQRETLRDMVTAAETTVSVLRSENDVREVPISSLVPGDVIIIPTNGFIVPCDAVLIVGSVVVDESMLTGESVPVTKTQLAPSSDDELYSPDIHKRNTLFCGTRVIQTRYYGNATVRAVVFRTGFCTAKGDLVRSILYPKEIFFSFYQDTLKFVAFLAFVAAIGMCYTAIILAQKNYDAWTIVKRVFDIVTVAVPPALPAAMTVGSIYAQHRLKKVGIFCISPHRINLCGKLQAICFDKTGTLTEEGLDFAYVVPTTNCRFDEPVPDAKELDPTSSVAKAMATCHSLTIIDGKLSGDPLDLSMFNSINWLIHEPGRDSEKFDTLAPVIVKPIKTQTYYGDDVDDIGIIRQFTFSSASQCMSVIVRSLGANHMDVYVKGAPEKIASRCLPDTLPADFQGVLHRFTVRGLRVIALATKSLDSKVTWVQSQRIARDTVERGLSFIGLLIFENKLKPETAPVIHELHDANIRMIMVTGDNVLTAVSVSRQCGLVPAGEQLVFANAYLPEEGQPARISWELSTDDYVENNRVIGEEWPNSDAHQSTATAMINVHHKCHLAVTGRSFSIIREYFPDLVPQICVLGTVFARMSPDNKSNLIEELQNLGLCVGMCGDGANDCGALRTAHAGISLSEAEASVASPFTSRVNNISCVPIVIREGRAALVTSFGVFRYMALYSIVQFVSVTMLYSNDAFLSDYMYLYIDLLIATFLVILMGHTGACHELVEKRPPSSLVTTVHLISILLHITIVIAIQTVAYLYLAAQPWYMHGDVVDRTNPSNSVSMDATTIFYVSSFQYLMLSFALSKGPPFRKRIWTNVPFLVFLIVLTILSVVLLLFPPPFAVTVLKLTVSPYSPTIPLTFRVVLLGIASINFFIVLLLELLVFDGTRFKQCLRAISCRRSGSRKLHKVIRQKLTVDSSWPPIGETTSAQASLPRDVTDADMTSVAFSNCTSQSNGV